MLEKDILKMINLPRAWESAIFGRWMVTAREILHFPSGGHFPCVGFCDSWAVDLSCA